MATEKAPLWGSPSVWSKVGDGEGTTLGSPVRSVVGSKVTVMAVVALVAAAVVRV